MADPHPPPPTPVAHPGGPSDVATCLYQDTFTVHRVAAQVHNTAPQLDPQSLPPPHVPNGPLLNGPHILPNGPFPLRNGTSVSMGGPHSGSEAQEGPEGLPDAPPALTSFGRPAMPFSPYVPGGQLSALGGVFQQSASLARHRPLDPRVEELRGRRSPKVAGSPVGRNGFCRPRRVTFLVEPVPEADENEEEDEELSSLHNKDDEEDEDDEEDNEKLSALLSSETSACVSPLTPRPDTRVRFLVEPAAAHDRPYTGEQQTPYPGALGSVEACRRCQGISIQAGTWP